MSRWSMIALLLSLAPAVEAATFTVTRFDDPTPNGCLSGDCSLREAVIAANATAVTDTIQLLAGTYTLTRACIPDTSNCNDLDVTRALKIVGQGPQSTLIVNAVPWFLPPAQQRPPTPSQADRQHTRVIETGALLTLEKLSLRAGTLQGTSATAAIGGCLYARASGVTLTDVQVSLCQVGSGGSGGGLALDGGTLSLSNVKVSQNNATYGGGVSAVQAPVSGNAVEVSDNSAAYGGGVYLAQSNLQLGASSKIAYNSAIHGGGISANAAGTTIIGGTSATSGGRLQVEDNDSSGDGGGIAISGLNIIGNAPPITLRNLSLRRNLAAGDGGGAHVFLLGANGADPTTIVNAEFTANESGGSGGGLYLDTPKSGSESNATQLSFWDNTAYGQGGAIQLVGGTTLSHISSTRNIAWVGGNSLHVAASSIHAAQMATPRVAFYTSHDEGQLAMELSRATEIHASALNSGCVGPWVDLGNNFRRNDMTGCPGTAVTSASMGLQLGNYGGGQRVVGFTDANSVLRNAALNYPGTRDARGYLRVGLADAGAFEYDGVP